MDKHTLASSTDTGCCSDSGRSTGKNKKSATQEHAHVHEVPETTFEKIKVFLPAAMSLMLLGIGLLFDYGMKADWFTGYLRLFWYGAAYLPVGLPVLGQAAKSMRHGDVFSEFFLMGLATLGAFAIGEYPEGVAVMLFYTIGEIFQGMAVNRAKGNIAALLDQRPDEATIILPDGTFCEMHAREILPGQIIRLKPGEKVALDGRLQSEQSFFNTAALTGESVPQRKEKGSEILAGMINMDSVATLEVTTPYEDSKLSRILEMVQQASSQKAPTELFIRKFAKIYSPIVFFLAVGICLLPYFFVSDYIFRDWLYRALVFLVISCPCALVISIPLGYFGGIGAASRNGILFKGGNYLDLMAKIDAVVMDKTGTLTEGVFKVQEVVINKSFNPDEVLSLLNAIESASSHPIATAIKNYAGTEAPLINLNEIREIPGKGLQAEKEGKIILAGNFSLLDQFGVSYDLNPEKIEGTVVAIAVDGQFAGYLTVADEIRADAGHAVQRLKQMGVHVAMLSGDKDQVVQSVAQKLGIDIAFGNLLPEDKVQKLKEIKAQHAAVAFVGDGVNDAPVVALSDVGIAMGGLGSDATIETADVVIQDDKPSRLASAIMVGRKTRQIVWQNIILAFGVKAAVLVLGAGGLATMWEAVFADVGVALLAVLNAVRIQNSKSF